MMQLFKRAISTSLATSDPYESIITPALAKFETSFTHLQSINNTLLYAGSSCTLLAYSFNWTLMAFIVGGGIVELFHYRSQVKANYKQDFNELLNVYTKVIEDFDRNPHELFTPSVKKLILAMGPWVPKEIIARCENKDLKLLQKDEKFKKKLEYFMQGKQSSTWAYQLYGLNTLEDNINILPRVIESCEGYIGRFNR